MISKQSEKEKKQKEEYRSIEFEMKMWRKGYEAFPVSYIEFHEKLARAELAELVSKGAIVATEKMEGDGWNMDAMKVLRVSIISINETIELKWSDSHSKGRFMIKVCEDEMGSGWVTFKEELINWARIRNHLVDKRDEAEEELNRLNSLL